MIEGGCYGTPSSAIIVCMDVPPELSVWIRKVAFRLPYDTDDLHQEGMIAAWQALGKNANKNPLSFAKKAAEWRMKSVALDGKPTFGGPKRNYGGATKDVPMSDAEFVYPSVAAVENSLVYHYREIEEALGVLTPNEARYVHLRFWEGLNTTELDTLFGYVTSPIWTKAKMKLRNQLVHLEGAV